MARNTPNNTSDAAASTRREFLRKSTTLALGACAVAATPLAWAASTVKPGLPPQPSSLVRIARWDAARLLSDPSHLRAGWLPPCASLIGLPYPAGLAETVSAVPSFTSYEAPRPVRVKLLGYDGRSGIGSMHLDALFASELRGGAIGYGWADVSEDRQTSTPSELTTWANGGTVPLQLSTTSFGGGRGSSGVVPIQLPAADGVYFALISNSTTTVAVSDLRFAEQDGGGYHRRLVTAARQPLEQLGYFLFVVQSA